MVKYRIIRKKLFTVIAVLVFLLAVYSVFKSGTGNQKTAKSFIESNPLNKTAVVSPTPFPFEELTIPYLRNRKYISKLSRQNVLSKNGNYTSYLTDYDSDGLKINGLLTIPEGNMPVGGWPAIVFIHGYIPPTLYKTTLSYVAYVDYLAGNGFVVFKIDLRGHGDSEGEPGGGYFSSDYIIDTLNAYAALRASDFVNPEKIGLWGHSMAGNVVFRSLAVKTDIPAAVIWAGAVYSYSDQLKYGIHDGSYRPPQVNNSQANKRQKLRELYGNYDPGSWFWRQVAATNYISDLRSNLQINHAVDDTVVNIGYCRDLKKLLVGSKVNFELNEYPSGGHNISGTSFNSAMQNTVNFYKKYL